MRLTSLAMKRRCNTGTVPWTCGIGSKPSCLAWWSSWRLQSSDCSGLRRGGCFSTTASTATCGQTPAACCPLMPACLPETYTECDYIFKFRFCCKPLWRSTSGRIFFFSLERYVCVAQRRMHTALGLLEILSGSWGSTTRKVFLPFRSGSRLPPSLSCTWKAPFKWPRVSSVMWTRLFKGISTWASSRSNDTLRWQLHCAAKPSVSSPRQTSRFHVICQCDIIWPHVILPLLQADNTTEHIAAVDPDSHTDLHSCCLLQFATRKQKKWQQSLQNKSQTGL